MNTALVVDGTLALLTVLARLGGTAAILRAEFARARESGQDVDDDVITKALDDLETHLSHFRSLK